MKTEEVVQALGALAQDTRLDVFRMLVRTGPEGLAAGEIARELEIPAPTLSFHLRSMLHAGLVTSRRLGRSLIYAANFEVMQQVVGFLSENCCTGSRAKRGSARPGAAKRRRVLA